jgi:outer membrane protein assembly factor BamA
VRLLALVFVVGRMFAADLFPVESLTADGISMPSKTLTELSGLKPGDRVDEAALRSATEKLQKTGLFHVVTFRYQPGPKKTGYAVQFHFDPAPPTVGTLIDIPGVREPDVWTCVQKDYPWLTSRIPPGPDAEEFVARAVGHCANGAAIVSEIEGDLHSGHAEVVLRPKELPRVTAVRFTGNRQLPSDRLEHGLAATAINSDFTERRFRRLLELNLRPLYEEYGMLNVRFTTIAGEPAPGGGFVATAGIDEGLVYKLAAVAIEGPDLPDEVVHAQDKFARGKVVVWSEILKSITEAARPLKRTGYLALRATTRRQLDDPSSSLNLTIHIEKGRQFFFNGLTIEGMSDAAANRARQNWRLQPGSPMDQEYLATFQKSLFDILELKPKKVAVGMQPAGTDKVNVSVTAK